MIADTKCYLQRYKQQFTNDKMFLQTYSILNMMLNKNDGAERNMSALYIKYLFKIDHVNC